MNKQIPNILSLSRIVFSPVLMFLYITDSYILSIISFVLLILVEITDALDGYFARKYNIVTDIGKIIDPFADTILHLSIFTVFLYAGIMPLWMFLISLYRDMLSMFVRILGALRGFAVAAKFSGKLKTASRAFVVCLVFLFKILSLQGVDLPYYKIIHYSFLIVTIITVYSFFDYIALIKKK